MVQLYMSKQMDVDALLTEAQYLQWVRDASAIVKLAVRSSLATSPEDSCQRRWVLSRL